MVFPTSWTVSPEILSERITKVRKTKPSTGSFSSAEACVDVGDRQDTSTPANSITKQKNLRNDTAN